MLQFCTLLLPGLALLLSRPSSPMTYLAVVATLLQDMHPPTPTQRPL